MGALEQARAFMAREGGPKKVVHTYDSMYDCEKIYKVLPKEDDPHPLNEPIRYEINEIRRNKGRIEAVDPPLCGSNEAPGGPTRAPLLDNPSSRAAFGRVRSQVEPARRGEADGSVPLPALLRHDARMAGLWDVAHETIHELIVRVYPAGGTQ